MSELAIKLDGAKLVVHIPILLNLLVGLLPIILPAVISPTQPITLIMLAIGIDKYRWHN
jgi:hypothetical protein